MTTIFKVFALFFIVFSSFATPNQQFIVVLDLSDRLLYPSQAQKDQALAMAVFEKFEAAVRKNLFIHSEDVFRVMIVPQVAAANFDDLESQLVLNMKGAIQGKRTRFDAFKKALPALLTQVFVKAMKAKTKPSDFKGSDIWKFFNDDLPYIIKPEAYNHLFVITDGYFDFESNRFVGKNGNRRTDSQMLSKFRNKADWKTLLMDAKEGLIPVNKKFENLDVLVLEVRPKFQNLNEQDLLIALWSKWLKEMNIKNKGVLPAQN